MDPITGAIIGSLAIQGVSALGQYFNSSKALDMADDERAYIQDLINKVQDPEFDVSDLTPQDLTYLGDFNPQLPQYIQENAPELLEDSKVGLEARGDIEQAINYQKELMETGEDPLMRIQQEKARRQAAADAQSARASSLQDAQRRGMADGGMSYMNALQNMQQSLLSEALTGEQAAEEAQNRRSAAGLNVGNLASNLRGQELDIEQSNVNAINAFNQRLAQSAQDYQNQKAQIVNDAQLRNLSTKQGLSNQNITQKNTAQQTNRNYKNTIAQQKYQNDLNKINTQTGASQSRIQGINDQTALQNQGMQSLADVGSAGADYYIDYQKNKNKNTNNSSGVVKG